MDRNFAQAHQISLKKLPCPRHNPDIDWRTREIQYRKTRGSTHEISIISLHQLREEGRKEEMFLFTISVKPSNTIKVESTLQLPKKYHHYADVFDKVQANTLPHHKPYDCPINLQPGKEPPWGPIYNLSPTELEVLRTYIEENLERVSFGIRNLQPTHPFSSSRKRMDHFVSL